MKTSERILDSASALLDAGGIDAVTLRALGRASGVSHNAPYKHFKNRDSLLGALATREFKRLTVMFTACKRERVKPLTKLTRALQAFSKYGREYPNRYRLLFNDRGIAKHEGELQNAALGCFSAFALLVAECQRAGVLPIAPTPALAGLLYASVHGLIDLHASRRMKSEKGFTDVIEGITLLLDVFGERQHDA